MKWFRSVCWFTVVFLLSVCSTKLAGQDITIVSWNIQDLGRTKSDSVIQVIAQTLRRADLVAIQEVVARDPAGVQAVARIAEALDRTGVDWDYRYSDPTQSPSSNISERYAFLWKPSKLMAIGNFTLDHELDDVCDREPYVGKFRIKSSGKEFIAVNFHSRPYNKQPDEEVRHFPKYLKQYHLPVLIIGDFNMNESHPVWDPFYGAGYNPAIRNQPTTLKRRCDGDKYLNHAIDNIYLPPGVQLTRGEIIDLAKECSNVDKVRRISDHLPVLCVANF